MAAIVFPNPSESPFTDGNGDIWDYNAPKTRWTRRPAPLGTAAGYNVGTTNGTIPLIGAGDKLPASILPSISLTSALAVANAAARLALTAAQAEGQIVKEADTGKSYGLVTGGVPSVAGDWILLGDGVITSADITDATSDGNANPEKILKTSDAGMIKVATAHVAETGTIGWLSGPLATPTGQAVLLPPSPLASQTWQTPSSSGTLALTSDLEESAPYSAGNVTGDITLNRDNGRYQKLTLTGATEARVFNPPTNGNEGETLTVRITDGGTDPRTLAFDAAILIPSDSGITFPKSLATSKTYKVKLEHNGTAWELQSLIGGY
jgi:hypothetical protein